MPWFRVRRKLRHRRRRPSAASRAEFAEQKENARVLVLERLERANLHYGLQYNKIFIRNTRSRWGSCSSKHNLGFNHRIAGLSPHLLNYIVTHELCHLKEFNHSPAFWSLVAQTVPDWKQCRRELHGKRL